MSLDKLKNLEKLAEACMLGKEVYLDNVKRTHILTIKINCDAAYAEIGDGSARQIHELYPDKKSACDAAKSKRLLHIESELKRLGDLRIKHENDVSLISKRIAELEDEKLDYEEYVQFGGEESVDHLAAKH